MPEITDFEWEEYSRLKTAAKHDLDARSIQDTSLEDDIDAPIKKCVMAFALLKCEPMWSCCGYDYLGQPLHKWHEYGRVFFILKNNESSKMVIGGLATVGKGAWVVKYRNQDTIDFHFNFFNPIPEWDNRDCPYYYEPAAVSIGNIEAYLLSLKHLMFQGVWLQDTSKMYAITWPAWEYPPRPDWLIRKEDL